MLAIIAIAALVGILWGSALLVRGPLLASILVFLLVACCFGFTFWKSSGVTIDRVALIALGGIFVVQWRTGGADFQRPRAAEWLLITFLGYLAVGMMLTSWQAVGLKDTPPAWRLVWGYAMPVGLYLVARSAVVTDKQLRWLYVCLIAFGLYLSFTAFAEVSKQWWLVFPHQMADKMKGIHFGRARGPMLQSCVMGMYLVTALLAASLWLPRLGIKGRWMLLALLPIFLSAVWVTYTRAVWLSVASSVFCVAAVALRGRWRPLVLGGMMVCGLALIATKWDNFVGFQRESSARDTRASAESRLHFGYLSYLMFLDRPILGTGFGQYGEANQEYLSDRTSDLNLNHIRKLAHHNTVLSLLTETGLVGMALFGAILFLIARNAWLLWNDPTQSDAARTLGLLIIGALATYAWMLITYEVSYTALETALLFTLAGLASGIRARQESHEYATFAVEGASLRPAHAYT